MQTTPVTAQGTRDTVRSTSKTCLKRDVSKRKVRIVVCTGQAMFLKRSPGTNHCSGRLAGGFSLRGLQVVGWNFKHKSDVYFHRGGG